MSSRPRPGRSGAAPPVAYPAPVPSAVRRVTCWGALVGVVMVAAFAFQAGRIGRLEGEPYVVGFPTTGRLNIMLAQGDGQAFAALATDPSLSRPEQFAGQTADTPVGYEAAYRAQRPLLGYLAWATSLGRPDLVNWALVLWSVVGSAAAVAGVAQLLRVRGARRPELALLVLVLPGSIIATSWLGPEMLGVGLAFGAWALVDRRLGLAVAMLCLAVLVKESFLLVPACLGLQALLRRDLRRAVLLGIPFAVFGAWLVVVHWRFGAWPSDASQGRLGWPLVGLVEQSSEMSLGGLAIAVANLLIIVVAWRYRRDPLAWLVATSVLLVACLGPTGWRDRASANRSNLAAHVAVLALLATGTHDPFGPAPARGRSGGDPRKEQEDNVDEVRSLLVGLTGGIGSGKSTVSAMLAARGAAVIDADAITRSLQQPGQPVFEAMVERFGPGIVAADGTLDRPAVARIVFNDADAKRDLEAIVHPAVGAEMARLLGEHVGRTPVVIYDVPLLVESGKTGYGAVVVVDVDPEVAVARLVEHRGFDEADARARIANQVSREDRLAVADRVVDNSGTLEDLEAQVDELWAWLVERQRAGDGPDPAHPTRPAAAEP